ncbi:MAG TPA: Gfo/Idh/MocA family oxidoreductase [Acidimicrobiia bacterium]|nr:Gfo/Idh/MocA family oxidoreductase [Acidimicrobiia bacterium]
MSPLQVLVVGAGRAGMVHARNLASGIPGARLAGVADPSGEARASAQGELGCVTLDNPEEAVADDRFDAVVIASPTPTHAPLAITALDAGKHVLSEKPLASNLDEAERIRDAAKRSSTVFMMGFMRRFDHGFARAVQLVAEGAIGKPLMVRSTTRGPGLPPKWAWDVTKSGGLVAEVNSHDIDTVRWVTGQEFSTVNALGRASKRPDLAEEFPGFVDLVSIQAELDGGSLAHIDGACPAAYAYDARMEVYGSEGVIFAGSPVEGPLIIKEGEARTDSVRSWARLFAEAYRAEGTMFAALCLEGGQAAPGIEDGFRALEAVMAINRSLRDGGVVSVDLS